MAVVIAHDVANDRQAETGAARVAASRRVDPIEAFEDSAQIGLGDADSPILDTDHDVDIVALGPDPDLRSRVGVLDCVVDQIAERRHQLSAVAMDDERLTLLSDPHVDLALHRPPGRTSQGAADDLGNRDLAEGQPFRLDLGEGEQVVDRVPEPDRFDLESVGEPLGDRRIVLGRKGVGQEADGPDRGFELVAHVGHEVAPDLVDPPLLGDVGDDHHRTDNAVCRGDPDRGQVDVAPRRAVEIETLLTGRVGPDGSHQLVHRSGDERTDVTLGRDIASKLIAQEFVACRAEQHQTER